MITTRHISSLGMPRPHGISSFLPLLALFVSASIVPAGARQAATVQVSGQTLTLQAKATRGMLFGAVELYSVGIYAAQPVSGVRELRSPQLTKAVRVEVLYDGGMPGKIPSSWWEELMPALTKAEEQKLREAFSRLSSGDDIWIRYTPPTGTTFITSGQTVISTDGHQLMDAVLDLWLDTTPVSQDVHDTLVAELNRDRG